MWPAQDQWLLAQSALRLTSLGCPSVSLGSHDVCRHGICLYRGDESPQRWATQNHAAALANTQGANLEQQAEKAIAEDTLQAGGTDRKVMGAEAIAVEQAELEATANCEETDGRRASSLAAVSQKRTRGLHKGTAYGASPVVRVRQGEQHAKRERGSHICSDGSHKANNEWTQCRAAAGRVSVLRQLVQQLKKELQTGKLLHGPVWSKVLSAMNTQRAQCRVCFCLLLHFRGTLRKV